VTPQPYKRVPGSAFSYSDAIRRRPELAAMAMEVIATWSEIEQEFGLLLSCFLNSEYEKTVLLYQQIDIQRMRRAVLLRIAKAALSPEDHLLLRALFELSEASEKRRNEFAHHVWAISFPQKNELLLVDPKNAAILEARRFEEVKNRGRGAGVPGHLVADREGFSYTHKDLAAEVLRAKAAHRYFQLFRIMILNPGRNGDQTRKQFRVKEIATKIAAIKKRDAKAARA
jgi:hypothetical protein